jgi:hypothetical protein
MKRASLLIPVLAVLTTSGSSAASKRTVELQVTLPNGAAPVFKVLEGDPATVEVNDGKFGFVPTIRPGDELTVVVGVFDLQANPHRQLGQVEAPVGADAVRSETTPRFSIRVSRVIAEK